MMGSALTVGCGQVKHLHLGGKKGGGGTLEGVQTLAECLVQERDGKLMLSLW